MERLKRCAPAIEKSDRQRPALPADHPPHEIASEALIARETTIAQAAVEDVRLPSPHASMRPRLVMVLKERAPGTYATLDPSSHATAPARLATGGVSGGTGTDGLIAAAAGARLGAPHPRQTH